MGTGWTGGSTRAWRKLRRQVLERDGYRCQLKRDGCTTLASHVHHLHGKVAGDDPAGLVAACRHCNLSVGNPNGNRRPARDPDPLPWAGW